MKLKGDESEGREQGATLNSERQKVTKAKREGQEAATATSTSLQEKFPRRRAGAAKNFACQYGT